MSANLISFKLWMKFFEELGEMGVGGGVIEGVEMVGRDKVTVIFRANGHGILRVVPIIRRDDLKERVGRM